MTLNVRDSAKLTLFENDVYLDRSQPINVYIKKRTPTRVFIWLSLLHFAKTKYFSAFSAGLNETNRTGLPSKPSVFPAVTLGCHVFPKRQIKLISSIKKSFSQNIFLYFKVTDEVLLTYFITNSGWANQRVITTCG